MNILLVKQISILSAILGAALGLLTIIPFIGGISFLFLMSFAGAALFVYMKRKALIGYVEPKDGALYGAICGFVSFLAFSVVYMPIAAILGLMFKNSRYALITFSIGSGFFVVVMLAVFVAVLAAVVNAFSAMSAAYIYNQIEPKPDENTTNFEIDDI